MCENVASYYANAANVSLHYLYVLLYRCRNIFAIRQSLTNVTSSREMDLDLARQYYELLNMSIEVCIAFIKL